jgi:hypothetical protein
LKETFVSVGLRYRRGKMEVVEANLTTNEQEIELLWCELDKLTAVVDRLSAEIINLKQTD